MQSKSGNKIKKTVILISCILLLLPFLFVACLFMDDAVYKTKKIHLFKDVAVEYVHSAYGDHYEIIDTTIKYGAISVCAVSPPLYRIKCVFKDQEGLQNNFIIEVGHTEKPVILDDNYCVVNPQYNR